MLGGSGWLPLQAAFWNLFFISTNNEVTPNFHSVSFLQLVFLGMKRKLLKTLWLEKYVFLNKMKINSQATFSIVRSLITVTIEFVYSKTFDICQQNKNDQS